MSRGSRRDKVALVIISILSGIIFTWPSLDSEHGLSIDILTALRWRIFGARHQPASQPAVVVAIDEQSFQTPPFYGSPTLTWTREIGRVLTAIVESGAKVVGFDVIFPTSIEQSEIPFGDEILGNRVRGFDRDFLRALANGAAAGKVVLGEVQNYEQSIRPSPGQRIAVHQQSNIRALNVYVDSDDVVRRLPLSFSNDGKQVPSMAVELASRALGSELQLAPDGSASLAGYRISGAVPNNLTLNFEGGADDIPTFSFADLRACVEKGDRDFFRRQFDGKVVIFGTVLDFQDRKLTSKRFATGIEGARAPRCALPYQPGTARLKHTSIAGVYIHATAVNNLIDRDAVRELGRIAATLIAIAFAAFAATAALALAPGVAALFVLGTGAAFTVSATVVFYYSLAVPVVEPMLSGLAAMGAMIGYRFVVADSNHRFLRKSFGLYLAPQVIEKMVASNELPALGGEMRNVTVFFSDVAGFSSIAEKMTPDALVALMNEYLSAMTDIVEELGGYVDKYIGDSMVAVFGAPLDDQDHTRHAVRTALRCCSCLEELNQSVAAFQGHHLRHRIGLNTGEALVGNIGSRRRFNYTVMSDAVNVASRLEGANKYFGTSILASETTVQLTGDTFVWRELDAVRVKGRSNPVNVYEPLAEAGRQTAEQSAYCVTYARGLAAWRNRDFTGAAACFESSAQIDPAAAAFLARARYLVANPPGADWEPVTDLNDS
jgi:adenylate cyclase